MSPAPGSDSRGSSYREILKSSALIGGSSALTTLIGIARTKAMAVLLGPGGYGLLGTYMLIVDLTRSVAQLGINASGVQQVAQAVASGDEGHIARTAMVLRRAAFACAGLGAVMLTLLAATVSSLSFGTEEHRGAIAWLSIPVALGILAATQMAVLQGMRRIADIAKAGVVGAVLGTTCSVALVYWFGRDGVVAALIAVAAASLLATWWYRRRVALRLEPLTAAAILNESGALLRLGLAFMASGLLTIGASYVVRIFVVRKLGLEAAGLYGAAWTLGGLYVGYVLQALGTDFYPRLVGAAADAEICNRLVNEQAHVSVLLALPGILGTLTFAPFLVHLFYTPEFAASVDMLRWFCLGMALRVLTWPLGYIVIVKSRQVLFFAMELAWTLVNVALSWVCIDAFGVTGAGIAFFASYVFHAAMVYPVARRLTGFHWTAASLRTAAIGVAATGAVFVGFATLASWAALSLGILVTLASLRFSGRLLASLATPRRPGWSSWRSFLQFARSLR